MDIVKSDPNNFIDFSFVDQTVRVINQGGNPWFVAVDVCNALALDNVSRALSRLDEDEKGVTISDTLGGPQEVNIINESGLYSLVLTSRKPEAKAFKKWITSEVIPSIRKTGGYNAGPAVINMRDPKQVSAAFMQMCEIKQELEQQIEVIKPKADALDRIANAEGYMNITSAAKHLQVQPKKLFAFMSEHKWIYKRVGGRSWLGYQDKVRSGHLIHKTHTEQLSDGTEKIYERVLVTPKGLAKLAELLNVTTEQVA